MIPLSIPHLSGNELKYVTECIETGWVSSAGSYVTKFEELVAEWAGCKYGVATSNGTSGLHLAMHMLGIEKDDIVLVPNITFIASANAVAYTKATPVFIDVNPETWQMDLDLLEEWLDKNNSPLVKAVMPVHVLGNMCDMPKLMDIAYRHGLHVIEDSTEALGSYHNGKSAGSFGEMNVFSFNGNKIITTGGGGVIVTNDEAHAKRAKHLSTQSKVDPETYFHDEIGFNYRLVNVLAAIGVAQMEQLQGFIDKKKAIDKYYREQLKGIGDLQFQKVEQEVDPNCWLFTFASKKQTSILDLLKKHQIIARPFWYPMNQLPMFKEHTYFSKNDHSKSIHQECLSIPSSVNLTEKDQEKVVQVIKSAF
jgi:aminotransferase in exopolysaccharide biosynthesis